MDAVDDTSAVLGQTHIHTDEAPSLLSIIIDVSLEGWQSAEPAGITFRQALEAILVFANAHLALHNRNEICMLGFNGNGTRVLYPPQSSAPGKLQGVMYRQFELLDASIIGRLEEMLIEPAKTNMAASSGPLSMSLAYANRRLREVPGLRARNFVLSVSNDDSAHHIATMNSIFAAQKLQVPIDVCNIRGLSPFLQQAADFTGGVYVDVSSPKALIQYMMSAFSSDPNLREHLNLPSQHDVNFSAVCYLTKDVIEIGHVCSVCLTILKVPPADMTCPVCSTAFETSGADS